MINGVFNIVSTRGNRHWGSSGIIRVNHPRLAACLAARFDHNPLARTSGTDSDEESFVSLFVNEHVISRLRADAMSPHLPRPHLLVWLYIEQPFVVCRPSD